jgi:DNA-binding transcriptional LysR family regulator
MLDLNRLQALREVGRQGSFSRAASILGYTQPAISRQIATLEREMQATLVDRNPRGVHLTDAGETLVEHTEAILARLADAEAEVRAIAELRGGRLRMASFPTAAATVAPLALAAFRRVYPEVELSLTMVPEPADALPGLSSGQFDIALSLDGMDDALTAGTDSLWLFDDPMHVALTPGHRLVEQRRITLADFREDEWVLATTARCPDKQVFVTACQEAGFEPRLNLHHHDHDYATIAAFVEAGMGISMIPDLAINSARADIVLRRLATGAPTRKVIAATKAGSYRSPAVQAMLRTLIDASADWVASRRAQAAQSTELAQDYSSGESLTNSRA